MTSSDLFFKGKTPTSAELVSDGKYSPDGLTIGKREQGIFSELSGLVLESIKSIDTSR